MDKEIEQTYGNRVRLRVCGLCWRHDKLLLVNHALGDGEFWSMPGGGLEFGETIEQALVREFKEETGFSITQGRFLFGCEYIKHPLHGIELFFEANITSGQLVVGDDPELPLIKDVAFLGDAELFAKPAHHRHGVFQITTSLGELHHLTGFYRI